MPRKPPKPPGPPTPTPVQELISILVPFRDDGLDRMAIWTWLQRFWASHIPNVEIIVVDDPSPPWLPFSKSRAINEAFTYSSGDVVVILDADTYMDPEVIVHCADRLRAARQAGVQTWFVPYQDIYRLTKMATMLVLESDPVNDPYTFSDPPSDIDILGTHGTDWGHRFGALIQIMPREAFELVGGMDFRFIGWGGEDIAFLKALDTLWGKHTNTPNDALHMNHERLLVEGNWVDQHGQAWEKRRWAKQPDGQNNDKLTARYNACTWQKEKMRQLVDEGHAEGIRLQRSYKKFRNRFKRFRP